MDSKIGFEMHLIVVEAIRGPCASFTVLTATVSEIFGGIDVCWSVMAQLKMFAIGLAITLDPYFSSSPGNSSLPLARLLLGRFIACCTSDSVIGSFRGRGSPVIYRTLHLFSAVSHNVAPTQNYKPSHPGILTQLIEQPVIYCVAYWDRHSILQSGQPLGHISQA